MERESGFVVATATRRQTQSVAWQRARAITTIAAMLAIGVAASVKVEPGTFSSVTLGPVRISCPLGVAQVIAASREFVPALVLAGLAGLGLIVLFGRAFCGWLCPGRWIFNRGRFAETPWRAQTWIQTALAGGVVVLAGVCRAPFFCVVCPAGVVCRGAIAVGAGGNPLPTVGWLGAVMGVEWLSQRSWCRDLCPLGAALSRLSGLNLFFRVKADPARCRACVVCERACPAGLNLARDRDLGACTKCMACIDACPRGAIELKVV